MQNYERIIYLTMLTTLSGCVSYPSNKQSIETKEEKETATEEFFEK